MDRTPSLKKRKSFRGWIKRVTTPKVSPAKAADSKQGKAVFGVPLVASISYARATIGYQDAEQINHQRAAAIPIVVAKCGSYLKRNGLETIGIFRLSGSAKRVNNLQHIFDSLDDSYGLHHNWEGYSIHDVGSVLRRYFLQLPDPVIPFDFYKKFRDVMNDSMYDKVEQRIDAFQSLICQLPTPHQHLLLYVLDLLRLFASNASVTRMDASNLAAVFTPGLLHHPSHNSPIEYKISQRVIEFLIEFQSLFTMDLLVDIPLKPIDPDEALVSPNIHHHSKKKINRRKTESDAPSPSNSTSLDSISSPLSAKSEPSSFLPPPPVPTLPPHLQTFNKLSPAYIPQSISNEQQLNIISDSPITYRDHHDSQSIISDDDNIPTPRPGSPIHKKNSFFLDQCISKLKINYYNYINNGSYLFNPGRLIWYTMVSIITAVFIYEGYKTYQYVFILEPYLFFIGFLLYTYLFIYGINLSENNLNDSQLPTSSNSPSLHHHDTSQKNKIIEINNNNNKEEELKPYQLNDQYSTTSLPPSPTPSSPGRDDVDNDGYSLFDDISILDDQATEEAMMKDETIMANWQNLITRAWRASPDDIHNQQQQQLYPALGNDKNDSMIMADDRASVLSMSSRFNDDIHYSEEEDDEEDDELSTMDDEELQLLWTRYEQFKKDEQLAEQLQKEEHVRSLEIQQKRDRANPFVIQ